MLDDSVYDLISLLLCLASAVDIVCFEAVVDLLDDRELSGGRSAEYRRARLR